MVSGLDLFGLDKDSLAGELKKRAIKVNSSEGLMQFTYSLSSPMYDPLVKKCRGIILDKDFNIVARPYDRFYEYAGETLTPNAVGYEKIDGSLIIKYFWNGWKYATIGSVFASGLINEKLNITFNEECIRAWPSDFSEDLLDTNITYLFELVSVYNQIVVKRNNEYSMLYLHGARKITGEYVDINSIDYPLKPKLFNPHFNVNRFTSTLNEGIVIINGDGTRFKKINSDYKVLRKYRFMSKDCSKWYKFLINIISIDLIGEEIIQNEDSKYFEEMYDKVRILMDKEEEKEFDEVLEQLKSKVRDIESRIISIYNGIDYTTEREKAEKIKLYPKPESNLLFALKRNRYNLIKAILIQELNKLLGK